VPTYHDEGICVRHWDWSETSQTVTLLTREHGLLRCIAKGSKREKAPFSGGVELLTRAHLTAIIKPNAELAQLTSWDLIEPMHHARREHARYAAAMYCVDLIPRTVHDQDPHPGLFDALAETLAAVAGSEPCEAATGLPAWLAWFQWRLLDETGAKPELGVDVRTGEDLSDAQPVGFAWDLGGLVALPSKGNAPPGVGRIRAGTARVLRRLDAGAEPDELAGTPDEITRAGRVLAARIRSLIGHEPPALVWVFPEISASGPG
jgi:DNA repair protein RecO